MHAHENCKSLSASLNSSETDSEVVALLRQLQALATADPAESAVLGGTLLSVLADEVAAAGQVRAWSGEVL